MKVIKKVIGNLNRCYSIAPLKYNGRECFLVASEKDDECRVYSDEGKLESIVWKSPGGVMSMAELPARDGSFLAVQKFYSPDDSAKAKIVAAIPDQHGGWDIRTLFEAPFAHRIGIISRGGTDYLLVCCLKSGHEHNGDWRYPGAVYVAELPSLQKVCSWNGLTLQPLLTGLLKNHGYSTYNDRGAQTAVIGCETGIWQLIPPPRSGGKWEKRKLTEVPSSDAVLMDFDGDGEAEIGSISPFHGDTLRFYRMNQTKQYTEEWVCPKKYPFLHASCGCKINGRAAWIVGNREGNRNTMMITWENGKYKMEEFDRGYGAANAYMLNNGKLVVTNRETDEIAMYIFES